MRLSETATAILVLAGWSEDRRLDTLEWRKLFESLGAPADQGLLDFLAEFGDLRWTTPDRSLGDSARIDPASGMRRTSKEEIDELREELGRDWLVPLGEAYTAHMTLFVTDRGEVLGVYEDVYLIGSSLLAAIETLCRAPSTVDCPRIDS